MQEKFYTEGPIFDYEKVAREVEVSKGWQITVYHLSTCDDGTQYYEAFSKTRNFPIGTVVRRNIQLTPPTDEEIRNWADCSIEWTIYQELEENRMESIFPCRPLLLKLDCPKDLWAVQVIDKAELGLKIFVAKGIVPWNEGVILQKVLFVETLTPCWEIGPTAYPELGELEGEDMEDVVTSEDAELAIRAYVRDDHQFSLHPLCEPTGESPTGEWEMSLVYGAAVVNPFVVARQQGGAWKMYISLFAGDPDNCWRLEHLTQMDDAT